MKLCRFNQDQLGVVSEETIWDVTAALQDLPSCRYPFPPGDQFITHLDTLRLKIEELVPHSSQYSLDEATLLSPVANSSKIVAAPINYQSHIDIDLVDPEIVHKHTISHISHAGLFLKAASSLVGSGSGVTLKFPDRRVDHEIELVVIIGRECCEITKEQALDYVAGYCVGLDMSIRGREDRSFRKSLDTYSVLGPWLTTADEIENPDDLDLELRINGELKQQANTRDLVYSVPELIEYASNTYTLYPGDILFTGTPHGVGPVSPGDLLDCQISGLGTMHVPVRAQSGE